MDRIFTNPDEYSDLIRVDSCEFVSIRVLPFSRGEIIRRMRDMKLRYSAWAGVVAISLLLLFLLPLSPSVRGDAAGQAGVLTYPAARVVDIVDDYHGTKVPDPYRWLEEPESAETLAFVEAQNRLARAFVDGPVKEQAKARLTAIWDHPRYTNVMRRGKYYTFSKNDGLQPQSVVYVQESLKGEPRVLLDPNKMSDDGTVAVSGAEYTYDGSMLAYGVSVAGSDQKDVHVKLVADGKDLPDTLKYMKFAGTAWTHDNGGFFYNRYPQPGSVPASEEAYNNKLYYHKLGTPQEQDALVYEFPQDKELSFGPDVTDDGKYLVLSVSRGSASKNGIMCARSVAAARSSSWSARTPRFRNVGNDGTTFYFQTDLDAPRGRLVAIDLKHPDFKKRKTLDRAGGRADELGAHGQRPVRRELPQGRVPHAQALQARRHVREGRRAANSRHGQRGGPARPGRDVRRVRVDDAPRGRVPLRLQDRRARAVPQERAAVRPGEVRDEAALRHVEGRDEGARVRRTQEGPEARRHEPDDPRRRTAGSTSGWGRASTWPRRVDGAGRRATRWRSCAAARSTARSGTRPGMLGNKQNVFDDFVAAAEHLSQNGLHEPQAPGDPGRQQRGAARRGVRAPAPGRVRRGDLQRAPSPTCCASTASRSAGSGSTSTATRRRTGRRSRSSTSTRRCTT